MIQYVAIFEQSNGDKFIIEYRPCYDEIAGGIEVFSVDFQPRPRSEFQIREAERRNHPRPKPRQLALDDWQSV